MTVKSNKTPFYYIVFTPSNDGKSSSSQKHQCFLPIESKEALEKVKQDCESISIWEVIGSGKDILFINEGRGETGSWRVASDQELGLIFDLYEEGDEETEDNAEEDADAEAGAKKTAKLGKIKIDRAAIAKSIIDAVNLGTTKHVQDLEADEDKPKKKPSKNDIPTIELKGTCVLKETDSTKFGMPQAGAKKQSYAP